MAGGMGVALLVVVVVTAMYQNSRHYVLRTVEGEGVYREASLGMREQVPDRSAVLCMQASGAVEYYTDLVVVRWDRLSAERFETLRRNIESKGFQWYALLFPFEEEGFRNRVPGRWGRPSASFGRSASCVSCRTRSRPAVKGSRRAQERPVRKTRVRGTATGTAREGFRVPARPSGCPERTAARTRHSGAAER